ncbi:HNH endonuclease [Burkholderia dolosa]|uniref:HNH endonuclease n=1 Tax=Burkholderia dolosa TaxID=152500 RepID=UPI0034531634
MSRKLVTLKPRVQQIAHARVATMVPGSWRAGESSSTARGYGYAWQKFRARHLANHPHCVYCLRELGMAGWLPPDVVLECATRGIAEPVGTIGDHIVPHKGDRRLQLDPSNVQTLCKRHHDSAKQREERRSGR